MRLCFYLFKITLMNILTRSRDVEATKIHQSDKLIEGIVRSMKDKNYHLF